MFSLKSFSRSYSSTFCSQRGVQPRVLDGDADVAGQRFQQFDVFAGEEVAFHGLAQAQHGDGAAAARGRECSSSGPAGRCVCCALGVSRGTWCVLSKNMCPLPSPAAARSGSSGPARWSGSCRTTWPARSARLLAGGAGRSPCDRPAACATGGPPPNSASRPDRFPSSARGRTRSASSGSRSACDRRTGRCRS